MYFSLVLCISVQIKSNIFIWTKCGTRHESNTNSLTHFAIK